MKILISFIILLHVVYDVNAEKPNTCNDYLSYLTMDPLNCWFNPDVIRDIPDIIVSHGYPLEYYNITTEDNYIITMFRMPKKNRRGIIYLQHPFLTNSVIWIDKGNSSLAFILHDAGYEVWIGHLRESIYGKKHKFLDVHSKEYWNFSFHETGIYDIPAQVDLIVNVSQAKYQEITYIGLSMSGTAGLVYASMVPKQSGKYLNLLILMAPSGIISHVWPLYREFAKSTNNFNIIFNWMGLVEFNWLSNYINPFNYCLRAPIMYICSILEMVAFGNSVDDLSAEWIPLKYSHKPDAVVLKTVTHYGQMANANKFQMYDYGMKINLQKYGSETPPEYPIQNIEVPVYLVYTDTDAMVSKEDIENLYEVLPENAKKYGKLFVKNLSHISYIYGKRVKKLVYLPLLELINNVTLKRHMGLLDKSLKK